VITFAKTRPIPLLEMGKKVCRPTKGASRHSKEPSLKNLPNMRMKVNQKRLIKVENPRMKEKNK
jgi:hypothetical protein